MFRKISILLLSIFLVGCSPSNPLNGPDHEKTAKELLAVSEYAESALKLGDPPYHGYFYEACMKGTKKGKDCEDLYLVMLTKLRQQKPYAHLTMANLRDQAMWRRVRDDYFNDRFNQI